MIRILLADHHAIVREGLRSIFSDVVDMQVIAEASYAADTLRLIDTEQPDIVVLDPAMPGSDAVDIVVQIKNRRPELPVLVLGMRLDKDVAVRALRAGAAGYITKDAEPALYVEATRKVANGAKFIIPSLAEFLAEALQTPRQLRPPHERLSDREYAIFRRIASGKRVSEIAEELALSVKTVNTYRAQVLTKLGVRNNAEIIRYAITNHLLD